MAAERVPDGPPKHRVVKHRRVICQTNEGTGGRPWRLAQQAFIDEQALQCGYCINGMIMSAKALLDVNPKPTDSQIKEALAGNLCRCGTHTRILRAVKRASGQLV